MPMTLNAPEIERRLQQEARKRGISAPDLALRLLEVQLAASDAENAVAASGSGWQQQFLALVDGQTALNLPQLPPAAFERESFEEEERHRLGDATVVRPLAGTPLDMRLG